MRPAIEVWRKALDATGCFIRFRDKPEQKAAAVIEAYAAEREAAAHAKAVAEIVAWLRTEDNDEYSHAACVLARRLKAKYCP